MRNGSAHSPTSRLRPWPRHPVFYEINTWAWLWDLSQKSGAKVSLVNVPAGEWDRLADLGVDVVWLMGVWERSPAGVLIANQNAALAAEFRQVLPDFEPGDNIGSAYCVRRYEVDPNLGGPHGLAAARRELAARGIRLMLDFVPNHVAHDHPWVMGHPGFFVQGSEEDAAGDPEAFATVGGRVFACGRDPYFPAWRDVLQLNVFSDGLRAAAVRTLNRIASQCDAVRCDMAMLVLNQVFERTWGARVGPKPVLDYWQEVIPPVGRAHPGFRFVAEAYWGLEPELLNQGFDFCYDKPLYDCLLSGPAEVVRARLLGDPANGPRRLRFIENHDEQRAAHAFDEAKAFAAAVAMLTLPGGRLIHDGQGEGHRTRVPVFLQRRPREQVDRNCAEFYHRLLRALRQEIFRGGEWSLCACEGWPDNASNRNLLVWGWILGEVRALIVVNYSESRSQGRIFLPWSGLASRSWDIKDSMTGEIFRRDGSEMATAGVFVDLGPWCYHFWMIAT